MFIERPGFNVNNINPVFNSNSVDPDQTPHSAASDLGRHCLSFALLGSLRTKMG